MDKNSLGLREERGALIKTAEMIGEKANEEQRALTAEQCDQVAGLMEDAEKMQVKIDLQERSEVLLGVVSEAAGELAKPQQRVTTPNPVASDGAALTAPSIPAQYRKYAPLKMFTGPNADLEAFQAGMWFRAKFFKDVSAHRYCESHGIYHNLAQSEGTGSAGGDLVPSPLQAAIINNRESFGVIRKEVELMPMSRDTLTIPRVTSDTAATFGDEAAAIAEADAAFDQVNLTARKMGRIIRYSTEVAADAVINLADWLAMDIARSFASKEDQVGFLGTAIAADGSITGVATQFNNNTGFVGAVAAASGNDEFSELDLIDFHTVMATLPSYALEGAKWFISSFGFHTAMMRHAAAGGGNTINDFQDGLGLRFLGFPVVRTEKLPGTGTQNATAMLLFGNLRMACILGERSGFTLATSGERYFELDQIALRATQRIDFNAHGVGDATTAGPVVALMGTA